jgi:5-hydroxyisourate hydrolase-like protein (transthyretin family)
MSQLTTHVLNIATGLPAIWMRIGFALSPAYLWEPLTP